MKLKTILFTMLLGLLGLSASAVEALNPKANPKAVVLSGNARFTVLTPEMIRIQYSDKGQFEDRATFAVVNRNLPVPKFSKTVKDGWLEIKTSALTLRYKVGSKLSDKEDSNDLIVTFTLNGKPVEWHPGMAATGNLKGTSRTLDRYDGNLLDGDSKKPMQFEDGVISRDGWAVINESPEHKRGDESNTFAFDKKVDGIEWWAQPVDKQAVDWYFMGYGHQYKKALKDFTTVCGKIPMPPLYVLGYWYSRYQKYTQQDFMNIADEIQQNKIPIDVMIFDMDWHIQGWTGWTWNKSIIPDPEGLIKYMHDRNMKVALNLHPADGVDNRQEYFSDMVRDMHMPADSKVVPWNLGDSTFYRVMFKDILRKREAQGVDFWWLDWQQEWTSKFFPGLSNTFWINHVFYNDMKLNRTDRRPFIFHRWGGLGSHRYPIGFSGDAVITYNSLAFEPYFTYTASNVGFDYWGHDLGGHMGGEYNNPDMYLRWMQFGVFTPIFRTHATDSPLIERRIWKYPNFEQLRNTVYLRYTIMPYIYNAARETYDTGVGMCRPLYYDYPEKDEAYDKKFNSEYMFGDNILVSPIVEKPGNDGLSHKTIWLPEGQWFDVCQNKVVDGNATFTGTYTLDDIPVFVKAGSIIPCFPRIYNLKTRPGTLILKVVPGAEGKLDYYEDADDDNTYQQGQYTITPILQTTNSTATTLTIKPRRGSFKGMPTVRQYEVQFLSVNKPAEILVNKKPVAFDYDASKHVATVKIADASFNKTYTVNVKQ